MNNNPASSTTSKPRRRFLRYSLRTMLVVVLVLSVWLGWMANRAAKQRKAVALVEELGGRIAYECEAVSITGQNVSVVGQSSSKDVFHDLLGHDWFHNVHFVWLGYKDLTDEQLGDIAAGLPGIEMLIIPFTQITDAGLKHLASLERLEVLDLARTDVTRNGVARLRSQRPDLLIIEWVIE